MSISVWPTLISDLIWGYWSDRITTKIQMREKIPFCQSCVKTVFLMEADLMWNHEHEIVDEWMGTVTNSAARWHKQVPGGVPQFVLRFHHSWSSPNYGSGFSSPKFTTTHESQTDYCLIINNVEEVDLAVFNMGRLCKRVGTTVLYTVTKTSSLILLPFDSLTLAEMLSLNWA